jgi:hypothetical protein
MNATDQTPETGEKSAAERAIDLVGGPTTVAKILNLPNPQAVSNWKTRGVPIDHCAALEAAVMAAGGDITRRDFYPDDWQRIWPELAEKV